MKVQWWVNLAIFCAAWLILYPYLKDPDHWGFIEYANLAFHESGHVVFSPFGRFMHVLGGTLGQLVVPAGFGIYFIMIRRESFSGLFSFFWFFQNFFGISRYMKDARFMLLPLTTDDVLGHDWNNLFGMMRLLHQSVEIGTAVYWIGVFGTLGMIAAMAVWLVLNFPFMKASRIDQ